MTIKKLIAKVSAYNTLNFGIDSERLKQKTLFNPETNDIHRLYSYVTETPPHYVPPLENICNYNNTFALRELSLQKHRNKYYKQHKYYGLCSRNDILLRDYIIDMSYFQFETSSFPELSHFVETLLFLNQYMTSSFGLFHHALLEYMCLLADGSLPYEEDCFHNFFLIDFSESPATVEAIQHFRLDVDNKNIRFIFKDYNTTLDNVFSELISKKDFKDFISTEYPRDASDKINNDILTILSNI